MSYSDDLAYDEDEHVLVDEAHVLRRVEDWLQRLARLYADVSRWADENGWSHAPGSPVPMDEEMMQKAGIAAREVVGMVVAASSGERVWFKPKALWVIGANGRIDIYARRKSLVLVDVARPFDPPNWVMYDLPSDDLAGLPFSPDILPSLI